jgi:23S rRNA (guanosine2251-2'-O)-methyltransferase
LFITGKNAIVEAINKSVVEAIYIKLPIQSREKFIIDSAEKNKIKIITVDKNEMEKLAGKPASILAKVYNEKNVGIEGVVTSSFEKHDNPLIFILDGITDVHNLGAIIRNAYFFGASGIVLPKDNSAQLNNKAYEVSSGAAYHIPITVVSNLNRTLDYLKSEKFWIYYASEEGASNLDDFKFDSPTVVILGSEHSGVRKGLKDKSDGSIFISSVNNFDSLNVSSACAVIAYAYSKTIK